MIWAKIGPFTNRSRRLPCSSSRISVPVMSDGIRSGVNWMRLKSRSRMSARVLMSSVFASPGTPVIRQWPPVNKRDQHLLDDVVLSDDDLAKLRENALAAFGDPLSADCDRIQRRRSTLCPH